MKGKVQFPVDKGISKKAFEVQNADPYLNGNDRTCTCRLRFIELNQEHHFLNDAEHIF